MSLEGVTTAGEAYREAVTRIATIMERLQKIPVAPDDNPDETYLAVSVRYLRKRDNSWDELFRAIESLERRLDEMDSEAAKEAS